MRKLNLKNIFLSVSIAFVCALAIFGGSAKAQLSPAGQRDVILSGVGYALPLCQDQNGNYLSQSTQNSVYKDIANNSPFIAETSNGENKNYTTASLAQRKQWYQNKVNNFRNDSNKIAYACAASSEGIRLIFNLSGQQDNSNSQAEQPYYLPEYQISDYKESFIKDDLSLGFGSSELSAEAKALRKKAGQALWQWGSNHYFEQSHYEFIMHKLDSQGFFEKSKDDRTKYCLLSNENFVVSTPSGNEQIGALEALCRATDSWQDVPSVTQTQSQKIKDAALVWAKANQQTFTNIYNNVYFPDGKYDSSRIPSDMIPESAFTTKSYWKKEDLDILYSKVFPKAFANLRDEKEFSCMEKDYLDSIWKMFGFDKQSQDLTRGPGGAQDMSGEIVLNAIPADRLIGIVGSAAINLARASERPIIAAGVKVAENVAVAASKAGTCAIESVWSFPSRVARFFTVAPSKLFSKVGVRGLQSETCDSISLVAGKRFSQLIAQSMDDLSSSPSFGKYFEAHTSQSILDHTYLVLHSSIAEQTGCEFAGFCRYKFSHSEFEIGVSDIWLTRLAGSPAELKRIFTHEAFHARSVFAIPGQADYKVWIDEGITEYLSRKATGANLNSGAYQSYVNEISDMSNLLDNKFGAGEGDKIITEAFFDIGKGQNYLASKLEELEPAFSLDDFKSIFDKMHRLQ